MRAIPHPQERDNVTIVETRAVTGGVDTHARTHMAAALDPVGGLLGVQEFPATAAGYARLLDWLGGFGTVCLVGTQGTGSYGAGLSRHITGAGIRVVEVDRSDRQDRRRAGKSDPLDAVSAARAAQSGRACGAPKGRDGAVEAIRALMVAKRSESGTFKGRTTVHVFFKFPFAHPDSCTEAVLAELNGSGRIHIWVTGKRVAPGSAAAPTATPSPTSGPPTSGPSVP